MRNLAKTIDRIVKIEPSLSPQLQVIREKWEKNPLKTHWRTFLKVLNTSIAQEHPKRREIQEILNNKKAKPGRKIYTFEPKTSIETIIGVIPENIECQLRRLDRTQLEAMKDGLEARMTKNSELMIEVLKKTELLDIQQRKLWAELKDHFDLWKAGPLNYLIRSQGPTLILTSANMAPQVQPQPAPTPEVGGSSGGPEMYMVKMDPEMLKRFFHYFNIVPPPGFFNE